MYSDKELKYKNIILFVFCIKVQKSFISVTLKKLCKADKKEYN